MTHKQIIAKIKALGANRQYVIWRQVCAVCAREAFWYEGSLQQCRRAAKLDGWSPAWPVGVEFPKKLSRCPKHHNDQWLTGFKKKGRRDRNRSK